MLWVLLRGPFRSADEHSNYRRFVLLTSGYASVPSYGGITVVITEGKMFLCNVLVMNHTDCGRKILRPYRRLKLPSFFCIFHSKL